MKTQPISQFQVFMLIIICVLYCTLDCFSDIRLMLSVNRALIKTNLGARVEIDCTLECDCVDLNISPMWVREDENALPTEITV